MTNAVIIAAAVMSAGMLFTYVHQSMNPIVINGVPSSTKYVRRLSPVFAATALMLGAVALKNLADALLAGA